MYDSLRCVLQAHLTHDRAIFNHSPDERGAVEKKRKKQRIDQDERIYTAHIDIYAA